MTVRDIMIPRAQMDVIVDRRRARRTSSRSCIETRALALSGHRREQGRRRSASCSPRSCCNYYAEAGSSTCATRCGPAVFVPESKRLNVLLRDFRANRNHIAIVVDEYGGVSGLVTIEDVLEQIVGDIEDEYDFDETEDNIIPEASGRYRVKAQTEIADFNAHFGTDFADDEFDTVGGLVLQALRAPAQARRDGRRSATSASACCAPTAGACYTLQVERVAQRRRRGERVAARRIDGAGAARRAVPVRRRRAARAARARRRRRDGVRLRAVRARRRCRSSRSRCSCCSGSAPTRRARRRARASRSASGSSAPACRGSTSRCTPSAACRRRSRRSRTAGFCAFLALFPALAGWVAARWTRHADRGGARSPRRRRGRSPNGCAAASSPAFRGSSLGYAQVPDGRCTPLAGYAPVGGVFLVSLAVALMRRRARARDRRVRDARALRARAALRRAASPRSSAGGAALARIEWTAPAGAPLAVSLRAGQHRAGPEVRPGVRATRPSTSTPSSSSASRGRLDRAARERVPGVRRRGPRRGPRRGIARPRRARRRRADRAVHARAAARPDGDDRATTTASSALGAGDAAALPQAPSGPVRRDDSARADGRLVHPHRSWRSRSRARRAATPTSRRSTSPASASRSNICYEDAFGARHHGRRRATRRCWSTSPTTPGTATRSPRSSTSRSRRCARSRPGARCCARPTPASRRRSITTAASSRGCRGSRAASSRSTIAGRRARRRTCASATRSALLRARARARVAQRLAMRSSAPRRRARSWNARA